MKKLKILVLLIALTLTLSANAYISIVSRTKSGCFPGCNSTSRTKTLNSLYDVATNTTFTWWAVSIDCSGVGVSSCPSSMALPVNQGDNDDITPFDIANADIMLTYAYDEIGNSNTSGTHSQTFQNTTTSETWVFTVNWSTTIVNGISTESIEVVKILL